MKRSARLFLVTSACLMLTSLAQPPARDGGSTEAAPPAVDELTPAERADLEKAIRITPFEGLGAVAVLVEGLTDEAKKVGLSEAELKNQIELRLRQSGVPVRDGGVYTVQHSFIYLNIITTYDDTVDRITYSTYFDVRRFVLLVGTGKICQASVWSKRRLGFAPAAIAREAVKDSVNTCLDFFLNRYLEANPKSGGKK